MALDEGGQGKMLLETLLSAALEAGFGLIAEAGFGDAICDLKDRLTSATERRRRDALGRAFARAMEAVGDDPIKALLEHRPFFEEIVKTLLDPRSGFDVGRSERCGKIAPHSMTARCGSSFLISKRDCSPMTPGGRSWIVFRHCATGRRCRKHCRHETSTYPPKRSSMK
jgi:hypothetical protein